jgi:hypothetical protein
MTKEVAMEKKPITCKKCGCPDLKWAQSNAGKWYLTPMEGAHIKNDNGRVIKTIKIAHRCDLYEEQKAEDARIEAFIIEEQAFKARLAEQSKDTEAIMSWYEEEATDAQKDEYQEARRTGFGLEFRTALLEMLAQRTEVR